jgi:hypothetical protein
LQDAGRWVFPLERCSAEAWPGSGVSCSLDRRWRRGDLRTSHSFMSMSWVLPTLLLLFAGAAVLRPLASAARRPNSPLRLVAVLFGTTLAVIGLIWLGWMALWVLERRWYVRSRL